MNSDPHENAAWRAFGMLDADEAAAFDEAARQDPELRKAVDEIHELTTALALVSSVPVKPRAGELDRLRARLGFPVRQRSHWFAWSGWAAAAVLALALTLPKFSKKDPGGPVVGPPRIPSEPRVQVVSPGVPKVETGEPHANSGHAVDPNATAVLENAAPGRIETKRLIQEIEVLRGQLARIQKRDRERFSPVPGVAWPIVMTMRPPGFPVEGDLAANSLNTVLGDALAGREPLASGRLMSNVGEPTETQDSPVIAPPEPFAPAPAPTPTPTAIPIYDSARDAGTLVVGNLPQLEVNESYNLWVRTSDAANPIYVGRLPQTVADGADALDFSLGSTGIVPSGFLLTRDADSAPVAPGTSNTILQGP